MRVIIRPSRLEKREQMMNEKYQDIFKHVQTYSYQLALNSIHFAIDLCTVHLHLLI